jgi:hypothetical protein
LNSDEVPDAPDELGPGQPLEKPIESPAKSPVGKPAAAPTSNLPASDLPESDLPPMADRKFGRRDGPTVER